ncbi:MAG: type II secretion system protein GspE [Myxococcales bacterium]|nr:type II secretion system protein GspE [Myxococcales bacterium]
MAIRRVGLEERLAQGGADATRLRDARRESERSGVSLLEGIQRVGAAPSEAVGKALAAMLGLPFRESIDHEAVDVELVTPISLAMAREEGFLPCWRDGAFVRVAIADGRALTVLEDLRLLYQSPIRPFVVSADVLRNATNKAYDRAAKSASATLEGIIEDGIEDDGTGDLNLTGDIVDDPNQAPIIKFVNSLLSNAVKDRASDIHIEPFEKELVVRFRIDGVLYEIVKPPPKLQASIVSRVKIMAGLNIAEKRIPQDGRIRTRFAGREIDLRVSTLPVRHGERVVMRILEKGTVFSLDGVGMAADCLALFREVIQKPHGIVLVTGPTGSGKTTTLYSALAEINAPDLNILTIEDPIEYELRGIGQTQVNPKIELTFASALRAHLRQDPDVILVGEIRDKETADNAVQASLTGHLVFSTLHTNDAATAFTRLIDMGVEKFLVTSSLLAVLAQRLLRRLCPECKVQHIPTDGELAEAGMTRAQVSVSVIYKAKGCPACLSTGYRGRSGVYEFLSVTEEVRELVLRNAPTTEVARKAREQGMRTLREDGIRVVLEGRTSLDEVMRVTQVDVSEA